MKKWFACIAIALLLLLIAAETGLRLAGFKPYVYTVLDDDIRWSPACPWYKDSVLGLKLLPGSYKVTYQNKYRILLTNNSHGYRITSNDSAIETAGHKHRLNIFGDSQTQGCGLNDEETFAWLLQKKTPQYEVNNYGSPGYGIANITAQITALPKPDTGDVFLLAYSPEQNYRLQRSIMKEVSAHPEINAQISFMGLTDSLHPFVYTNNYRMWALSPYSALCNFAEDQWNNYIDADQTEKAKYIAQKAIRYLNSYCTRYGATFILVVIDDQNTGNLLPFCNLEHILNTDVSVDLNDTTFNQSSYNDRQPNPHANVIFADRIFDFLHKNNLLQQ